MNEAEINKKVNQLMSDFENTEEIWVSSEWNQSLLNKLSSNKRNLGKSRSRKIVYILLIVFVANAGIVLNIINNKSNQLIKQESKLKTISKELLINPISINN